MHNSFDEHFYTRYWCVLGCFTMVASCDIQCSTVKLYASLQLSVWLVNPHNSLFDLVVVSMHRSTDQRLVILSDIWFPSLTNILFIACCQSAFRWCKMQKTCSLMSWCVISNQARKPFRWCSGELRNICWIKFCFSAPGSFASILTEVKAYPQTYTDLTTLKCHIA